MQVLRATKAKKEEPRLYNITIFLWARFHFLKEVYKNALYIVDFFGESLFFHLVKKYRGAILYCYDDHAMIMIIRWIHAASFYSPFHNTK